MAVRRLPAAPWRQRALHVWRRSMAPTRESSSCRTAMAALRVLPATNVPGRQSTARVQALSETSDWARRLLACNRNVIDRRLESPGHPGLFHFRPLLQAPAVVEGATAQALDTEPRISRAPRGEDPALFTADQVQAVPSTTSIPPWLRLTSTWPLSFPLT